MSDTSQAQGYVLATGDEGKDRLGLVDEVHGADTRALLEKAGIARGMRVADIGCGVGLVTCTLAQMVAPDGEVVGVDISPEQIQVAQGLAEQKGIGNVRFVVASAYATGLEAGSFDATYARFVLMHLARPADALAEMARLLRPGGTLIVEDGDFTSPYCAPASPAYLRAFELYRDAVRRQGADPEIGPSLIGMVMKAGFRRLGVAVVQPVLKEGAAKRLPELTLLEAAPEILAAGAATEAEIQAIAAEVRRLADDVTTEFGMAQMTQIWATKP